MRIYFILCFSKDMFHGWNPEFLSINQSNPIRIVVIIPYLR